MNGRTKHREKKGWLVTQKETRESYLDLVIGGGPITGNPCSLGPTHKGIKTHDQDRMGKSHPYYILWSIILYK